MKQFKFLTILLLFPFFGYSQNIPFKKVQPCSFEIEIPADMKIQKMYPDSSPDYCDYKVKSKDGYVFMELHSLLNSRFSYNTIQDLYNAALRSSNLNISYKFLAGNYFIISGRKKNGNIIYWKRVLGKNFISDLNIEYSESKKLFIEKNIGRISKSFTSY